ncbi:MAG: hypothetical protein ACKOA8_15015, partial [Deltaproteobacteria bacterium]
MSIIFFFSALLSLAVQAQNPELVPVASERFLVRLQYLTPRNFLGKNVYEPFGLNTCYVRKELLSKLKLLEPTLKKKGKKLILWDCYR